MPVILRSYVASLVYCVGGSKREVQDGQQTRRGSQKLVARFRLHAQESRAAREHRQQRWRYTPHEHEKKDLILKQDVTSSFDSYYYSHGLCNVQERRHVRVLHPLIFPGICQIKRFKCFAHPRS